MKTIKNFGVLGFALLILILGGEYLFASWLQGVINSAIPQGEWYNLIHLVSIFAHIFVLGGAYVAIAIWSVVGILALASSR